MLQKNVASQKWLVFAFDLTTNAPETGDAANITAKIRKDFGSATAVTDTNPTELESGYYEFDLTQAETNANVLDLIPVSATSNIQVIGCPARMGTVPSGGMAGATPLAAAQTSLDAHDASSVLRRGTAQAGAAGTITLDAGASAVNDFYNGCQVVITSGTGTKQARLITDYVGATKVATIGPNWATNPDNTSVFSVLPGTRVQDAAFEPGTVYALRSQITLTSTAGTAAHLRVWAVDGYGRRVDVETLDPTATAELTLTEHSEDGGSLLFTESFADTDQHNKGWEKLISTPGFTSDRMYVADIEAVINGVTYTDGGVEVVFG